MKALALQPLHGYGLRHSFRSLRRGRMENELNDGLETYIEMLQQKFLDESYFPARRPAGTDPMRVLRQE